MMVKFNRNRFSKWQEKIELGIKSQKAKSGPSYNTFGKSWFCDIIYMSFFEKKMLLFLKCGWCAWICQGSLTYRWVTLLNVQVNSYLFHFFSVIINISRNLTLLQKMGTVYTLQMKYQCLEKYLYARKK